MAENCKSCGHSKSQHHYSAEALAAENATLRMAILNYWGTCNPPMNEAQQRCEDALLAVLSEN
jgi:hypothetical protein